ncbi:MAG: DUF3568 family protein [Deltaproteobacteria bacterium]|nr:DUF3568 family protein [Deltaproteobacteria bacterium]
MLKSMYRMGLLIISALMMIGCDAAVIRDGRVIGIHSGSFIYSDGYLRVNYRYPLDAVWKACEKTVADMKASNVAKAKKIATGTITSVIQDEKVTIVAEYVSKDMTTVSVLVGMAGNNIASQLIHEKIGDKLQNTGTGQEAVQTQAVK